MEIGMFKREKSSNEIKSEADDIDGGWKRRRKVTMFWKNWNKRVT
jgi:hypothetical protein